VRAHGGRLLAVARRFLGNDQDAQDAVQDAFIRAYKAIHTFESRAQLYTWLHRILVNTALMKLRERRRRPTESIEDLLPAYVSNGHQAVASRDWSDAVLERKETAAIVREAIGPDQFGTIKLPARSVVMIAPWVLHRHHAFWRDPAVFDPSRFMPDAASPPRFAFMPFGAGPRVCVGAQFALLEMTLVLALFMQRFHVALADTRPVLPVAVVTTQPDHAPPFLLRAR